MTSPLIDPEQFFTSQLKDFKIAQTNFLNLQKALYRTLKGDHFLFQLQYNPERIRSTAAKVDEKTLKERKCFLCAANLLPGQKGIPYRNKYNIFINPYPKFDRHFTIPDRHHTPQLIDGRFGDMLMLAKDFPAYTFFYNGPKCGASAPDHFHFQMATRGVMPVEKEIENCTVLRQTHSYQIGTIENYMRKIIVLTSDQPDLLENLFLQILSLLSQNIPSQPEPMINLLCWYTSSYWNVIIFPRRGLRPRQFYEEGNDKILFSPGCVDFAGLLVTPRKEDYDRYTPELLADLFGQLTLTNETWEKLSSSLRTLIPTN